MKPIARKSLPYLFRLQSLATGNVIAKIKGSTKKMGGEYQDAIIILYNKANFQPIAIRKPDENGSYQFIGLNTDLKTFIAAFDKNQQFNAVIQDNVVPK